MDATSFVSTSMVVELLSQLVARRTAPGHAHLIRSATECESYLRAEVEKRSSGSSSSVEVEGYIRRLRNQLVHRPINDLAEQSVREFVLLVTKANEEVAVTIAAAEQAAMGRVDDEVGVSAAGAVADAFVEHLVGSAELLGKLEPDEATRLGKRAAEQVLAAARWSQVVGDRLDTTQVSQLLGISRQALAKRQNSGSLLGLPGDGTTWYPTWQFDLAEGSINPVVRDVIGAFRDRLDDLDPLMIASWATTNQDEDLAGHTPAQWLRDGRDPDQLRQAAERAASRLAR